MDTFPLKREDYAAAGQLLSLTSGLPSTVAMAARICATYGKDAARAWLAGWWYAKGVEVHPLIVDAEKVLGPIRTYDRDTYLGS